MTNPFYAELLDWYDQQAAQLPWRQQPVDAYRVWLSEIMLQQTQVHTVIPYYTQFLQAYPTVNALAEASHDDVLKLWEGLGYYSRARSLHQTARVITQQHGGVFPASVADLMALPGIGRYTAGAIASIAFNLTAPVLDGNVIRVFARLIDLSDDVTQTATRNHLWELAESWMPDSRPGDYNQALMELGRTVCKARSPLCDECPISAHCLSFANHTQNERSVKTRRAPIPHFDVVAGIIRDAEGRLLIAQRPTDGLLGGLWEFPGGKQEDGETLPQALMRELDEELGIKVQVGDLFVVVKHAFTHFRITLHAFECLHSSGHPQPIQVQDFAWAHDDELDRYSFGKADREIIRALRERRNMLL